MKAPRIGEDDEAKVWLEANWDKLCTEDMEGNQLTLDGYITANFGKYILEAVPDKEKTGLGSVSGILVDPTSFRGKVIGFIEWLPSYIASQAYEDMDPAQLTQYGRDLLELCEAKVRSIGPGSGVDDEPPGLRRELEVVGSAAKWCIYWGSNGHSMHAWY